MESLPIAGIVLAAFFSLLIISKKIPKTHDYILLSWLLLIGFHQFYYYLNFHQLLEGYQPFLITGNFFPFLYGPLILLYVITVVAKQKLKLKKHLWHFLPFVYFSAITIVYYYLNDGSYVLTVYDGYLHKSANLPYFLTYWQLMAASGGIYPLICLWLLQKHNINIKNEFSYSEKINLRWLKYWIICSIASFGIIFSILTLGSFNLESAVDLFKLISLTLTIGLVVLSYFGLKQTQIFVEVAPREMRSNHAVAGTQKTEKNSSQTDDKITVKKYGKSGLAKKQSEDYVGYLKEFMIREKPYLENKLSLNKLAMELDISTNHLSQVINEQFDCSFFDFINQYRVEEVKDLFNSKKHAHYTILALAFECGFNSKTSFNSNFKRFTGITPSQFQKNMES